MKILRVGAVLAGAAAVVLACGSSSSSSSSSGDGGRGADATGQACTSVSQCYPGIDAGALHGTAECLTQVTGGYCTHDCTSDADCCAVPGECAHGFKQVCAPFESTGKTMCFLSCEDADVASAQNQGLLPDAGTDAANAYCQTYASTVFGCRSTGGGKNNRKVCLP